MEEGDGVVFGAREAVRYRDLVDYILANDVAVVSTVVRPIQEERVAYVPTIEKRDDGIYVVRGHYTWALTHYPAHTRVVLSDRRPRAARVKFEGMILGVPYHHLDNDLRAPMGVWVFARSAPLTGSLGDVVDRIDGCSVFMSNVCMGNMTHAVYSGAMTPEEAFWNSTFPLTNKNTRWNYGVCGACTLLDIVTCGVVIDGHYGFGTRFFPYARASRWIS